MLYVAKMRHKFPEARTYCKALEERECHLSKAARRKLSPGKTSQLAHAMGAIKKQLRRLILEEEKGSVFESALVTLRTAYTKTVKCYHAIEPADSRTLHQTRVAFKRFRYMIGTLHPILSGVTEGRLKSMHDYQTRLGDIQDVEVLLSGMDKFLKRQELTGQGWKRFRAELVKRRKALVQRFMACADELFEFDPVKSLGARIGALEAGQRTL